MMKRKPPGTKKSGRKPVVRKPAARKPAARKNVTAKPKRAAPRHAPAAPRISPDFIPLTIAERPPARGLGPESAGQSGDTTGLSRSRGVDFESVEDLVEEGQVFEAGVLAGVENTADADPSEVTTREVQVDDVPAEYFEPTERR